MTTEYPLISAITIVKDVCVQQLEMVIECFENQTYPYKELVIINNARSQSLASQLEIKARKDVYVVDTPTFLTSGHARNYAIQHCNGQIIAQFDYDMWHNKIRLESQLLTMINNGSKICVLSKCMLYYMGNRSYMTNHANAILQTMMYVRPHMIDYPQSDKGEELGLLEKLINSGYNIISLDDASMACKIRNYNDYRDWVSSNIPD